MSRQNQMVPSAPQVAAPTKFAWGLMVQSHAPRNAKNNKSKHTSMKTIISAALFHLALMAAYGQGQLWFANIGVVVNAPVTNAAGNLITAPGPYVADLFWSGSTDASPDELQPYGFNTGFLLAAPGYFEGRIATFPLPSLFPVLAQVRVWNTTFGATYSEARDSGGEFGYSNPIVVLLASPGATPSPLTGLQGFQLQIIPEPGSVSFGLLIAFLVLLNRLRRAKLRTRCDGVANV